MKSRLFRSMALILAVFATVHTVHSGLPVYVLLVAGFLFFISTPEVDE